MIVMKVLGDMGFFPERLLMMMIQVLHKRQLVAD